MNDPSDESIPQNDKVAEALGIEPHFPIAKRTTDPVPVQNTGDKLDDDTEYARQNLYDVVSKTSEAVDQLMEISRESQHPRSYEVLGALLKQQGDAATQLLDLHKKKVDIQKAANLEMDSRRTQTPFNINNAVVFNGTSSELLDLVKGKNHNIIEHADLYEDNDVLPSVQDNES